MDDVGKHLMVSAREMLVEFQTERQVTYEAACDAQACIDSGRYNAFLELSFRRNRDDAMARVTVLDLKIQVMGDLIKRTEKRCQT